MLDAIRASYDARKCTDTHVSRHVEHALSPIQSFPIPSLVLRSAPLLVRYPSSRSLYAKVVALRSSYSSIRKSKRTFFDHKITRSADLRLLLTRLSFPKSSSSKRRRLVKFLRKINLQRDKTHRCGASIRYLIGYSINCIGLPLERHWIVHRPISSAKEVGKDGGEQTRVARAREPRVAITWCRSDCTGTARCASVFIMHVHPRISRWYTFKATRGAHTRLLPTSLPDDVVAFRNNKKARAYARACPRAGSINIQRSFYDRCSKKNLISMISPNM